jgi:exopolysaccharide biosynthesis polyprenyl glycosylphosphotransferase
MQGRGGPANGHAPAAPPRPARASDAPMLTTAVVPLRPATAGGEAATGPVAVPLPLATPGLDRLARALLAGRGWLALRVALDVAAGVAAVLLTLRFPGTPEAVASAPWLWAFPLPAVALLALRGGYRRRLRPTVLEDVTTVGAAVAIAVMVVAMAETYAGPGDLVPVSLVHLWLASALLLLLARATSLSAQRAGRERGLALTPALIVGAGVVGARVERRLLEDQRYGLVPVGYLDAEPFAPAVAERTLPVLGTPDDLEAVARRHGAEHVVLAFSATSDRDLAPLVQRCERAGIAISLVPRFFESLNDRVGYEALGGIPLLGLRVTDPRGWRFAVKHAIDRTVAAALLLALSPLLVVLALGVRLSSPGPVFFRQRRVGRDGRPFDLLKFRSMAPAPAGAVAFVPAAGAAPGGVEGVDRRTAIGRLLRRTSLDELPQLINVLRGEMSLVGPRPERPEFVERFECDIERYGQRHRVRAGITGWAQVNGLRGQTSISDRAEWDNFYIEHWSLGFDLRILVLTALAVLRAAE